MNSGILGHIINIGFKRNWMDMFSDNFISNFRIVNNTNNDSLTIDFDVNRNNIKQYSKVMNSTKNIDPFDFILLHYELDKMFIERLSMELKGKIKIDNIKYINFNVIFYGNLDTKTNNIQNSITFKLTL